MKSGLLFSNEIEINKNIKIRIPTLADILKNEKEYYSLVHMITAMPIDMMVQLDDMGIDFTSIKPFDLFILLFNSIRNLDTSLVFGDLDLSKFELAQKTDSEAFVLIDPTTEIVIDELCHFEIAQTLRDLHGLKRDDRRPGNDDAKEYLIKRARKKQKREANKPYKSQLEALIVALVNTEEFKYNYQTVKDLTIYQFNKSVEQVVNKVNYNNRMHGVYAGTIDSKSLSQEDLSWIKVK